MHPRRKNRRGKDNSPSRHLKKIRVLHVITKLEFGGAQQNTLYTVEHLDSNHFEVGLAAGDGGYLDAQALALPAPIEIFWLKFMIREIRPWWDLAALIELWRLCSKWKPDIVHLHSSKAGILGRWAAFLAGVPVIIHTYHGFGFHDFQKPWLRYFLAWVEKISGWVTTQLIYVSRQNISYAEKWGIRARRPAALIRSGVSLAVLDHLNDETRREKRKELGLPEDSLVIVTTGNLKPQKNPQDFLRLAQQFQNFKPTPYFLFLGGSEGAETQEKIFRQAAPNFKYLGWRKDSHLILKASDLFVMTSLWEGLPRSAVEALRLGLPVIAYAIDGLKDIVRDGENGFLAQPHDLETLKSRLHTLMTDSNLRQQLSQKAKASIGQEFDIDFMVKQQEELYSKLLGRQ